MNGKLVFVTGATSGLGKATATALAAQGARVIVHGRDLQKTQTIVADEPCSQHVPLIPTHSLAEQHY